MLQKSEGAEGFFNDGLTYLFTDGSGLQEIRPKHIHFEVMTEGDDDFESCDLRFYSVEPVEDAEAEAASARLRNLDGHEGDDMDAPEDEKPAEENKDKKQPEVTGAPKGPSKEYSAVEFSDVAFFRLGYFTYSKLNVENMLQKYEGGISYSVDLWLDWDDQRVSIYINDVPIKSAAFFTQKKDKIEHANALSIYGLSPGSTSKFRNITVCDGKCLAQKDKDFENLSGALHGISMSAFSMAVGFSAILASLVA